MWRFPRNGPCRECWCLDIIWVNSELSSVFHVTSSSQFIWVIPWIWKSLSKYLQAKESLKVDTYNFLQINIIVVFTSYPWTHSLKACSLWSLFLLIVWLSTVRSISNYFLICNFLGNGVVSHVVSCAIWLFHVVSLDYKWFFQPSVVNQIAEFITSTVVRVIIKSLTLLVYVSFDF